MLVQGMESHVVIIAVLLLIGVPTNVAVVWIHTRKDSRVAKNKFPLIFAAIDLIAILVGAPMPSLRFLPGLAATHYTVLRVQNAVLLFAINGYLTTLLMATLDKFYAVMLPFKYRLKHPVLIKVAVIFAFGVNLFATTVIEIERLINKTERALLVYNFGLVLVFLATIVMFVVIVAKLIHNGRKLHRVGATAAGRLVQCRLLNQVIEPTDIRPMWFRPMWSYGHCRAADQVNKSSCRIVRKK